MPNARLNERAPFFAEVDVLGAGMPAPCRVWGGDISETGMFVQTTHPFRVGDRVSLRFDCADDAVHVRAAEIMWVRPFEAVAVDGQLPGVGVKFVALDPPSRAALRKLVAPHLASHHAPHQTPHQTQGHLDSLPPPVASLPPITQSILAMTTRKHALTDEMFAVSLPPFSQLPQHATSPPRNDSAVPATRVFQNTKPMGTPAPITIGPRPNSTMKDPSMPPVPLAGWTFRSDDGGAEAMNDDVTAINPSTLDLRFDDDDPAARGFERAAFATQGDFGSTPAITQIPDEDSILSIESAVMHGDLAIKQLPIAEERRTSRAVRSSSRALPVAITLLVSGTLAGLLVGTVMRETPTVPVVAHATPVAAVPVEAPVAAPVESMRSVADIERELVEPSQPALPARPQVEKSAAVFTASTPEAVSPKPAQKAVVADQRSIEVRVGDAKVIKAFTLGAPSRVVIDIQGGQLPKNSMTPGGGISKVRFGTPAPGTGRVVIELDQQAKASGVETWIKAGVLVVTFR